MKRLSIDNYLCEKPKRKSFGNITFLNPRDGEVFLAVHGQNDLPPQGLFMRGRPRPQSNLQFMGTDVYCKLSNRKPQEFALRTIEHTVEERKKPSQTVVEEEESSLYFNLHDFSCGHCSFYSGQLAYIAEVHWWDRGTVKFTKRNMLIKLDRRILIRVPLNTVIHLVWSVDGSLTVTLSTAPLFFRNETSVDQLAAQLLNTGLKGRNNGNLAGPNRTRLCSLEGKHADVVGQCLVYQFHVSALDFSSNIQELKTKYEITLIRDDLPVLHVPPVSLGEFTFQLKALRKELADYTRDNSLPFGILFQLQALAYNAYLHPATVLSLAKTLRRDFKSRKAEGKRPISVDAMRKLFDMIDWPSPHGDPEDFQVSSLFMALLENEHEIQEGFAQRNGLFGPTQNLARIHKVTVTPTRITLHGPEMEPNNRILRKFPNHHDYFIRVQFCDENGQDLYFNPRISYDDIFTRFKNVMKRGIEIAGRTYTFLGFSHSSLRSHSVWFSAPFFDDDGHMQTYFNITKALGDFSHITSPARCAARIGQAFSDTPYAVPLDEHRITVTEIPDVKSRDGSRVFSDGVGTVSWDVAETIWCYLPLKKSSPTCFQIRMGGAKGMLAVDSRLHGSVILVRPSMIKFDTEDMRHLEICDVGSKPIPLVLNRQMIKILEDMGVGEEWFFKLQNAELTRLRRVTANVRNTASFLQGQSVGDCIGLHKLFRQCGVLKLDYRKEPFLRSVVEAVVLRELRLLKHKARIPVEKGITLFGIMDETGFLQEHEVYVTFNTMDGRFPPPPGRGRLVVTRSPALHDGDIQFAYNAVPPKGHPLTKHRNCIVFSKAGNRDLPSKLSGGDLDGDLYNIIWDPEARPTETFEPADYPRVPPINIGRPVTKDDMADFFVDFMRTDHLGIIATRHMILADQMDIGTRHPDCKKLAQLHSTAVDFSKTGIPVKMEELPKANNYRPDFLAPGPQARIHDKSEMELDQFVFQAPYDEDEDGSGPHRKYYKSEKILGKLYRAVDERKIWYEDVRSRPGGGASFWDEFVRSCIRRCNAIGPIMWTHRAEQAKRIRSAYEDAIFIAMNDFSDHPINPISELEVFIGYILSKTGVQSRRQRDHSIRLKDEVDRITTWITHQMRPHGNDVDAPLTGYETEFDALELCLACVYYGGDRNSKAAAARRRLNGYELQSFRVVAACALLAELDLFEKGKKEGGYVGVNGGGYLQMWPN